MSKNVSGKLLATAAASAVPFVATDAVAQDLGYGQEAIDHRINMAFEGGVFLSQDDDDKSGAADKFGADETGNFYGSIALSRKYDTDLDWRIAGTLNFGSKFDADLSASVPDGDFSFNSGSNLHYQTIDFDLGKHVRLDSTDVRLFAGVRGLHVRESFDADFSFVPTDPTDKSGEFDKLGTADFWGIGPRVGAEVYHGMGQNWGLTGSVSAAAMWGRRTESLDFSAFADDPSSPPPTNIDVDQSVSSTEIITNLAADAGVSWEFAPGKMVTGGYRIDHWNNLRSLSDDNGYTTHGPFLRLNVKM